LIGVLLRSGNADGAREEMSRLGDDVAATLWIEAGDQFGTVDALTAARCYVQAARIEPANVEYRVKLTRALIDAQRYRDALEHAAVAAELAPERTEARVAYATVLYKLERFAEASDEFRMLARQDPSSAAVQYFLACSLERTGACAEAIGAFERFLTLADPSRHRNEIDAARYQIPALRRLLENGGCKSRTS
jgi:cytochrome c-type biogenesis protein CcmH/NrfG